jgi:hypothetical protein
VGRAALQGPEQALEQGPEQTAGAAVRLVSALAQVSVPGVQRWKVPVWGSESALLSLVFLPVRWWALRS